MMQILSPAALKKQKQDSSRAKGQPQIPAEHFSSPELESALQNAPQKRKAIEAAQIGEKPPGLPSMEAPVPDQALAACYDEPEVQPRCADPRDLRFQQRRLWENTRTQKQQTGKKPAMMPANPPKTQRIRPAKAAAES